MSEQRKQINSRASCESNQLNDSDVNIAADLTDALELIVTATDRELIATPTDQKLRQTFHAVARKFSDKELCVEPVLASLVSAVTGRFSHLSLAQHNSMSLAVAATLFEDAESRLRLERLWHRLRGEV